MAALAPVACAGSPAEFGVLLARLRHRAGVSQHALSRRTGINQSYICNLEAGRRYQVSRHHTLALADGLGLGPDEEAELLCAAGHVPASLAALVPVDPLVAELAAVLADLRADPRADRWLRRGIAAGMDRVRQRAGKGAP
jgi:transcriptional regulator with XRE-family HTH domain